MSYLELSMQIGDAKPYVQLLKQTVRIKSPSLSLVTALLEVTKPYRVFWWLMEKEMATPTRV